MSDDISPPPGLSLVRGEESAPESSPPIERAWKLADVMAFTRMGKTWVYEATRKGLIPCKKLGNRTRYDPNAVRAWWERYDGKGH